MLISLKFKLHLAPLSAVLGSMNKSEWSQDNKVETRKIVVNLKAIETGLSN